MGSFRTAVAGVVIAVVLLAAGQAGQHAAQIVAVLRGIGAVLVSVLAAAVLLITFRMTSRLPSPRIIRQVPDYSELPPPARPDPGWVTVASIRPPEPAPPAPVPPRAPVKAPADRRHLRLVK